jgi:hypothetical protein
MLRFLDRVGGILVAPRETLERVSAGEGGLNDVIVLLVAKVLADQMATVARGLLGVPAFGGAAALQGLLQAASSALPDVLAILIAGVALALVGGANRRGRGRELDLAAYAWVPYLAVKVAVALVHTALGRPPGPTEEHAVDAVAIGWSVAVWLLALRAWRRPAATEAAT